MDFFYPPLILCSSIATLFPFLASATVLRYVKSEKGLLPLLMFFSLAVATEITLYILNSNGKPSAWISHIYTPIEFVLITTVLAIWQPKSAIYKPMIASIPFYLVLNILSKIIGLEVLTIEMNSYVTRPLALILLSTFALLTLHALWRHIDVNIIKDFRFWMLLAFASYYSISIVLYAFMFAKDQGLLIALFNIHAVANIIHNILFTIGVFILRGANMRNLSRSQYPDYSSA